jgi:Hypothetical protein (DUF2513)
VKRDFDLIRQILLHIEETSKPITEDWYYHFEHEDRDAVANSLDLLLDRKLIEAQKSGTHCRHPADWFGAVRLTWEGCDFLDAIRDDAIWEKTKASAAAAGGFTFDILKSLAKGLIKKKIEDHTGIALDL